MSDLPLESVKEKEHDIWHIAGISEGECNVWLTVGIGEGEEGFPVGVGGASAAQRAVVGQHQQQQQALIGQQRLRHIRLLHLLLLAAHPQGHHGPQAGW